MKTTIATVTGKEAIRESQSASCYHASNTVSSYGTYTIACIDYVLYHQNVQKQYNYFPSLNDDFETKIIAEYDIYPADLTFDYIKNELQGSVVASEFRNSSPGFGSF